MPQRLLEATVDRIKDEIDTIRNEDGACTGDAQAILQSIADYALECKHELRPTPSGEFRFDPATIAAIDMTH